MHNYYIKSEAKKNFKDWTKEGLNFLLGRDDVDEKMKKKCRDALYKITTKV